MVTEQVSQLAGLTLHTVKTTKFKTNTIVLKCKAPLNKEDVTKRALLPYVLQSGTAKFPTSLKLRSYLDDLFGATLQVDVAKKGEYQILTFRMDVANEKYLQNEAPLLEKALEFLAGILLEPEIEDDAFKQTIVDQEKRALKQRIESVFDDKMRYANMRLLEEMCETEPYRLHTHGNKDEVEQISAKELFAYYQKVLTTDEMDLYIVGDINEDQVVTMTNQYFTIPTRDRNTTFVKTNALTKIPDQAKEVIENQDIKQGKLHLGFRTNVTYADDDYYALQMFNGIFGGFSHSKLFLNVREKASLAYYAASRIESHKGLLLVMSGIEFDKYEQAVSIIKEQMAHMQEGHFSDEEVTQTKAVIKNQMLETIDAASGLIEILYHNVISGVHRPLDEWLKQTDMVTHEEIVAVGQKVKLDTTYFLTGLERE